MRPAPPNWASEAVRVLSLRAPRWHALQAGPLLVAALVLAQYLLALGLQWLGVTGPAELNAWAWLGGWLSIALAAWLCWLVAHSRSAAAGPQVQAPVLFALLGLAVLLLSPWTAALRFSLEAAFDPMATWPHQAAWALWLLPFAWLGLAQIRLLWRHAGGMAARAAVLLLTPAQMLAAAWLSPVVFWAPAPGPDEPEAPRLVITQEVIDTQPRLLAEALAGLQPQRPGRVDVFALSYAPYATQDVFMRESALVTATLKERFGAQAVQLVVNPASATRLPWATPANLRRAIQQLAARMDREQDLFFIHLTSHGGKDGKLAVDTWPLASEPVTPQLLKAWLDEAGIRWRVISVSACYSGSWIAPLRDEHTLVMTAADATHTSYGCGTRSELTFFGRAMYADALRQTRSFAEAHAQARELIAQREKEAGKSDGYSNPQIAQGAALAPQLERLLRELRPD